MAVLPMPDSRSRPGLEPGLGTPLSSPEAEAAARLQKKKDKVRAAWISFAGRIVAQVVGAAVTVALTLFVVQKAQQASITPDADSSQGEAQPPIAPPPAVLAGTAGRSSTSAPAGGGVAASAPAIAVLPLDNFSGDTSQDAFVDAMTEALIAQLAQVKGLRVVSRTSSMRYRGSGRTLPEIADDLGATHLIEGSVSRDTRGIRVTAQLIDAASDRHVWAAWYDRRTSDLAVQAELAGSIARDVAASLAIEGSQSIHAAPLPQSSPAR